VGSDKLKEQFGQVVGIGEELRIEVSQFFTRSSERLRYDRRALGRADPFQRSGGKVGRLAALVGEVLLKSPVVDLALELPDGRKDLLLFGLAGEVDTSQIGAVALRKIDKERILSIIARTSFSRGKWYNLLASILK
jgi:hypothetical protein